MIAAVVTNAGHVVDVIANGRDALAFSIFRLWAPL